jgi:hypothetical protein
MLQAPVGGHVRADHREPCRRHANRHRVAPHYNSVLAAFEKSELTDVLTKLIEQSAAPLASVERHFSVESTGFGTCVYRRWYDARYGKAMKQATWLKAHAIVGTTTNVIASVKVTDSEGADSPQLPGLVEAAKQRFELGEVSADKAYLGHDNLKAIETAGASPFIPFKLNSQADGPAVWRKMHAVFMSRKNSSPPTRSGTTSRARSRR